MFRLKFVLAVAVLAVATLLTAAACSSGPSQAELDAAKAQADIARAEANAAKAQLSQATNQVDLSAAQIEMTGAVLASDQRAIKTLTDELTKLRNSSGDQSAALVQIQAALSEKEKAAAALAATATALEGKLKAKVPVEIAQVGQVQGAPAAAQPSGWDTAESVRGGLKLVATFDSSGPDAWDVKAHPNVYVSSEGGVPFGAAAGTAALYPGLHLIDSYSKELVASANYNLGATVSPHTVGVSQDGKWFYLEGARSVDQKTEIVVFIINARTLKIDKVLKQQSMYQGALRTQNLHHVTAFTDSKGNDRVALEFGFGSTGGPHFLLDPKGDNKVVKAITMDDTGYPMGHPFLTVDPTGKFLFVSLKMAAWSGATHGVGGIAKINMENWAVTVITAVGDHIIGMMTTADGKFLYANDGEGSRTYKIDLALNQAVANTSASVAGPYGMALTWDEKLLYLVGKGEGAANQGHVLGVIDTTTFRPASSTLLGVNQPIELGGNSRTVDHAQLHPDPKVNELWISNMGGPETTVLDLNTNKVIAHISTPHGGNTHSGGFIKYNADWTGTVLADHGGPKKDMLTTRAAMAKAAAVTPTAVPATATPTAAPK